MHAICVSMVTCLLWNVFELGCRNEMRMDEHTPNMGIENSSL